MRSVCECPPAPVSCSLCCSYTHLPRLLVIIWVRVFMMHKRFIENILQVLIGWQYLWHIRPRSSTFELFAVYTRIRDQVIWFYDMFSASYTEYSNIYWVRIDSIDPILIKFPALYARWVGTSLFKGSNSIAIQAHKKVLRVYLKTENSSFNSQITLSFVLSLHPVQTTAFPVPPIHFKSIWYENQISP